MSKQFYLIRLNNDRSMYLDSDLGSVFKHIRKHDGQDVCFINCRAIRPDEDISLTCECFKSDLTAREMLGRILT